MSASRPSSNRRALLRAALALPLLARASLGHGQAAANASNAAAPAAGMLRLSGPAAAVSFPLLHMVDKQVLREHGLTLSFTPWRDPDQLRALAVGQGGDYVAMPTNVAANLYNRGVPLRLLNVSMWGVLWMVSRRADMRTLADFRGEEIALPFRADMPDIVFSHLAEQQGLDPRKDFRLRYTATPMDALQLLVMRRVDHALLAEPMVSMALRKTRSFPISVVAPELYRSVNLQEEWGRVLGGEARIPQAGVAALGKTGTEPVLAARFEAAYAASLRWCIANPEACGHMVASHFDMLTPEAVADSVAVLPRHYATAAQARPELEAFFRPLLARQAAMVGGRLPDAAFYGGEPRP